MTEDKSKSIESKSTSPDELTKTKKQGDVQLNEEELGKVSGGSVEILLKIPGVD